MKPMKVKELIAVLREMNPNAYVGLSRDSEGNGYSLMADESCITSKCYLEKGFGAQDCYIEEEEYAVEGDTVKDIYGNNIKRSKLVECIILWPTN